MSRPERFLSPLTPIKHVDKRAEPALAALWPSGMFVEHAGGEGGESMLRCQENWERFGKCLAVV